VKLRVSEIQYRYFGRRAA